MGIMRVAKNNNYTVMNRTALNDTRLSWKAKGIIAYMLSMPDDWVFYFDELVKHSTDGKASFRAGFNELKTCGYVERRPIRQGQRIKEWETIVHEIPQDNSLLTDFQHVEKQEVEKQEVGFQEVENRTLLSTDINQVLNKPNTDKLLSTDNNQQESRSSLSSQIFELIESNNFAALNSYTSQEVEYMIKDTSEELTLEAFKIAIDENKRKLSYVKGIIRNWKSAKLKTLADLEKYESSKRGEQNGTTSTSAPKQYSDGVNF
ncbi:DnaD domain-containing protein [Rummeliibacillus pycnus]|uniref:DnaD domain-containing protein n=1 Tax=Rummeliibacillus pycnus TaxID=101070 RepID=UPI0037CAA885